jgi:proteasome lid subunit RPN8/RPN11
VSSERPSASGAESDFALAPRRREGPQATPADIPEFALDEEATYALYIEDHVLNGVRQHVQRTVDRESGGILLGRHFQRAARTLVHITSYAALPSGNVGALHFDFDQKAILAIHSRAKDKAEYPVGWFHSHPKLGDPFMSQYDLELHRQHFRLPWHVSCVVAVGEWSTPVGFWRMDGDRLLAIGEHYIHMTHVEPLGEQSRRLLRACDAEERPVHTLLRRLRSMLPELGVSDDGPLATALASAPDAGKTNRRRSEVFEPLAALMGLAELIADDSSASDDVQRLRENLKHTRFEEDSLTTVIRADVMQERMAICGDTAISVVLGTADLVVFDFVANEYGRVHTDLQSTFVDAAFAPNRNLIVLQSSGGLFRMAKPRLHELQGDSSEADSIGYEMPLDLVDAEARELCLSEDALWVRSSRRLYRLAPSDSAFVVREDTELPSPTCVLIKGAVDANVVVLDCEDGTLSGWNAAGARVLSHVLPAHFRSWKLSAACRTAIGTYALFDDGKAGQLLLLRNETLEVATQYLRPAPGKRQPFRCLCADDSGRVFVSKGNAVSLLVETGSPSKDWYLHRVRTQTA